MKSTRAFSRKFNHSKAGDSINFIVLILLAAFMSLPMLYTISNAFKLPNELFLFPPTFFPKNPTFNNFKSFSSVMRNTWVPISRYMFNSLLITVFGTMGNVILSSLAAYRLSKYQFPGSKMLFRMVVLALMFSPAVTSIPNYIILNNVGLLNTPWAIIIPACAQSLGLFLMKQFMDQMIPDSLLEAARIDGATEGTIFIRIVLPLVKPAWLTLIIFSFQNLWSNTGGTYIYDEEWKTLPYALSSISATGLSRAGVSAAISVLMLIPPILVFVLSQSNVLQTMATSGMKD